MKRVAREAEQPLIVGIPLVVSVTVVAVEPELAVVVAFEVEQLRIAVGVHSMRNASHATAPRIFHAGCILCAIYNRLASRTKYLNFLKREATALASTVIDATLGYIAAGFGRFDRGQKQMRLLPSLVYKK